MARGLAACLIVVFWALPAVASAADRLAALLEANGLKSVLSIMRDEGLDYAGDLEAEFFPGAGGGAWERAVSGIYDPDRMYDRFAGDFAGRLKPDEIEAVLDFFESELGARMVALELSARSALLDEDVEAQSRATLDEMVARDDPRLEQLRRYVEVNDLIDANVVGALNANFAFYLGLEEGDAFPYAMSDAEILADVWAQEESIRLDTEEWIYSYLAMAYRPLSDAELEAAIDFSETGAAQRYNRALFDSFDALFVEISRSMGRAAARFMSGERI
jgi:hypothetical protein